MIRKIVFRNCFEVITRKIVHIYCSLPKIIIKLFFVLETFQIRHCYLPRPQQTALHNLCTSPSLVLFVFRWKHVESNESEKKSCRMFSDVNIGLDTKSEQKLFLFLNFPFFSRFLFRCGRIVEQEIA